MNCTVFRYIRPVLLTAAIMGMVQEFVSKAMR